MTVLLAAALLIIQSDDAERIAALIRDLDAEELDARDRATRELTAAGKAAVPALEAALRTSPSEEVASRIPKIIDAIGREIRRKEFKGGAPLGGFCAQTSVELREGRVFLTVEIMNIDTRPLRFVPAQFTDTTLPATSSSNSASHGRWVVRQLSGSAPQRNLRATGGGPPRQDAVTLAPGESWSRTGSFAITADERNGTLPPGDYEAEFHYYAKTRKLLPEAAEDLKSNAVTFTVPAP